MTRIIQSRAMAAAHLVTFEPEPCREDMYEAHTIHYLFFRLFPRQLGGAAWDHHFWPQP